MCELIDNFDYDLLKDLVGYLSFDCYVLLLISTKIFMQSFILLPFMTFLMLIFCKIYDYFRFIPELKKSEIAIKNGHDTIRFTHPRPSFTENCCFFFAT